MRNEAWTINAGVEVRGDAAAYALVWEFGNVRQHTKGPKTTLGVNLMTGERVWLTIQAPFGYVRVNEQEYWQIIKKNLQKLNLGGRTKQEIRASLEAVAYQCAQEICLLIQDTVPVDTGYLRDSIFPVEPGDPDLLTPDLFSGQIVDLNSLGDAL